MPFQTEHSARLREPGEFAENPAWNDGRPGKFRRTSGGKLYAQIDLPQTVSVVWGKLPGRAAKEDPPAPQSLRFAVEEWTADEARAWLKENKIQFVRFEAATAGDDEEEEEGSAAARAAEAAAGQVTTMVVALKAGAGEAGGPPQRLRFLPAGELVGRTATGDFHTRVDKPTADRVVARFRAAPQPKGLVDYDHESLNRSRDDKVVLFGSTRAAGWIEDWEVAQDGAIVACVAWTPTAQQLIRDGEYRFYSPVFTTHRRTGALLSLDGMCLTNDPHWPDCLVAARGSRHGDAILVALSEEGPNALGAKERTMDLLQQLVKLLGLPEGTDEFAMMEKLRSLIEVSEKPKLEEEAEEVAEAIAEVVEEIAEEIGEEAAVPATEAAEKTTVVAEKTTVVARAKAILVALRARKGGRETQLAALRTKVDAQGGELAALRKTALEREADDAVQALIAARKVAGEQRTKDLRALYLADGKEAFELATRGLTAIAALRDSPGVPDGATTGSGASELRQMVVARAVKIRTADPRLSSSDAEMQALRALQAEKPELFRAQMAE